MRLAVLPRARADPQSEAVPADERGLAIHEVFGCLRVRLHLVRIAVRRVSVQVAAARIGDLASRTRHEAIAGQPAGISRCERHSDDVLVVPSGRPTRLQSTVYNAGAIAEEAARTIAVASDSAVALSRVGFLEEGVRWCVGEFHRRIITYCVGHLRIVSCKVYKI